jgi:hypothetical protein
LSKVNEFIKICTIYGYMVWHMSLKNRPKQFIVNCDTVIYVPTWQQRHVFTNIYISCCLTHKLTPFFKVSITSKFLETHLNFLCFFPFFLACIVTIFIISFISIILVVLNFCYVCSYHLTQLKTQRSLCLTFDIFCGYLSSNVIFFLYQCEFLDGVCHYVYILKKYVCCVLFLQLINVQWWTWHICFRPCLE